jgi:protein involved in polysaccharide export with SLBB domain
MTRSRLLWLLALSICAASTAALSQTSAGDPLNLGPRGMTQMPPMRQSQTAQPPAAPTPAAVPAPLLLPPDPASAIRPIVFGSQIFTGRFSGESFSGFNPDYQLAPGDRVIVRIWGAFSYEAVQVVDAQGNIFIPNVGPVGLRGVRNADLNRHVEQQAKRTFRANVGVYATLEAAQPVKVYVTGFVRAPGLYGGLSSDSVLHYLDKAGGIDADRGSYLEVDLLRGGKPRTKFNLYRFLLDGQIESVQLQDGDTLVAHPRKHTVQVSGEVLNPYIFEFATPRVAATELLKAARPRPGATHLSIVRKVGTERRSEYHTIAAARDVSIEDGDEVTLMSDKYAGTILVRIEGAHLGERTLVLPYGSRLKDALARVKPAPQSRLDAMQLYRKSVAQRQKEMLDASLRSLETYALTARSATSEEAALRTREAELILQFIERAKNVQPRGQVILANKQDAPNTLLEDGDVLRVPEESNLVLVSGEVLFPNALIHDPRATAADYVKQAGGYTQNADASKLVVLHQDGSVADAERQGLRPGDEIMVLPKIDTKRVEITRGITQIVYQIAVAARVLLGL